jgi:hypothetical protein
MLQMFLFEEILVWFGVRSRLSSWSNISPDLDFNSFQALFREISDVP